MMVHFNRKLKIILPKFVSPNLRDWDLANSRDGIRLYSLCNYQLLSWRIVVRSGNPPPCQSPSQPNQMKTRTDMDKSFRTGFIGSISLPMSTLTWKAIDGSRGITNGSTSARMVMEPQSGSTTQKGTRSHRAFSSLEVGPYLVLNRMIDVVYRIQRSPISNSRVIHSDLLRPSTANHPQVCFWRRTRRLFWITVMPSRMKT